MVLGIIITFSLIILGLCFGKSKVLSIIQALWMWIIIGFNTNGIDYEVNLYSFEHSEWKGSFGTILSSPLSYLFYEHGASFLVYNVITTFFAILIIYWVINKFTKRIATVLALIMIFPFPDFVVQKRFFLAMAIAFLGFSYYIKDTNDKKNIVKCLLLLAVSSQFHVSTIFYLIIIAIGLISNKLKVLISAIGLIVCLGVPTLIEQILLKIPLIPRGKVILYFEILLKDSSPIKALFWVSLMSICVCYVYLTKKNFNNTMISKVPIEGKIVDNIYRLHMSSLILIPFFSFDPVFFRLFRPIIFFEYIMFSRLLSPIKADKSAIKIQKKDLKKCFEQLILCSFIALTVYCLTADLQGFLKTMYSNNYLLTILGVGV